MADTEDRELVRISERLLSRVPGLTGTSTADEKTRVQRQIRNDERRLDDAVFRLYGIVEGEKQHMLAQLEHFAEGEALDGPTEGFALTLAARDHQERFAA